MAAAQLGQRLEAGVARTCAHTAPRPALLLAPLQAQSAPCFSGRTLATETALRAPRVSSSARRAGRIARDAAPDSRLWTPDAETYAGLDAAATALAALAGELQRGGGEDGAAPGASLDDASLVRLVGALPALLREPPADVRTKLEALGTAVGCDLVGAAALVAAVPSVWGAPPEAAAARVKALAKELGVGPDRAAALVRAVPPLFGLNATTIVKDRLDTLGMRLGLSLPEMVELVAAQPVMWAVPPPHIVTGVPRLSKVLGLTSGQALELVQRVPVVVAVPAEKLVLGVGGLAPTLGVEPGVLLELLGRCLALAGVAGEVVGAGLTNVGAALGVGPEGALALTATQPALLTAQLPVVSATLDALQAGLGLDDRSVALQALCAQPGLMYELTPVAIGERLEALAAAFGAPVAELKTLAALQPMLLLVAPSTLRAALAALTAAGGGDGAAGRTRRQCLDLLVADPAAFLAAAYDADTAGKWAVRLGLEPEEVGELVGAVPALLELSPNTVKARLESLCALLGIPLRVAVSLVRKHPALAAVPPNAIIARVKSVAMALGLTMPTAGTLIAKAPALLVAAVGGPGELNRDLKPHVAAVQEIVAAYEFYTMDWLQRSVREAAPVRARSFSTLDK